MIKSLQQKLYDLRIRTEDRTLGGVLKRIELVVRKEHASTVAPSPPSHVMLELITRCNLRCEWCQLSEKEIRDRISARMELDTALSIVRQLRGIKVLMLYGLGEPLMYDGLETVIAEAKRYIPTVCFTTNGILLNSRRARALADAGLTRIHVSLDSLEPDFFRKVTGGGDISKILKNLENFSKETGLPVRIWSVLCRDNIDRLHHLLTLKERIPTFELFHVQLATGNELLNKHGYSSAITPEEMRAFKARIRSRCDDLGIKTDVGMLPDIQPSLPRQGICSLPWTGTVLINIRGNITPCCILREHDLANVEEYGFSGALNHPDSQKFRADILAGRYLAECSNWCGYQSSLSVR